MLKSFRATSHVRVGNAIIWAAVMLASAMVTRGSEGADSLMLVLIAGWLASSFVITGKK